MSSKSIQIDGEDRFTTRNRAKRFIRDGRAEWTDATESVLRFCPEHHAQITVVLNQHATLMRLSGRAYDHIRRVLTAKELRAIPFAGDVSRLLRGVKQSA